MVKGMRHTRGYGVLDLDEVVEPGVHDITS
jgi:hypothetical protein